MKDSLFAGWLAQRKINKRLTLGTEVYSQGAQEVGARESTFLDAGGYFNFTANVSLLFMLGHTVAGERHTVGYVGLYYTWGRDQTSPQPPPGSPLHIRGVFSKLFGARTHEQS
jgi:hypothetical protein